MATIRLQIYLLLLCCSLNFANGGVCPASTPTVRIVDTCPTTKAEMEKAAQRKKCDMMQDVENCDGIPVYHCLLNQWGNATVEVCTSSWYISGFCAIYNTEQMKVIDDFNRDCTEFSEGKCPSRYHSPEAYMYELCYRIGNSSTNPPKPTTHVTSHQLSNGSDNTAVVAVLGVFVVLLLVLIIILILERQRRIPKIGLPIRTCRDIETGKSPDNSEEAQQELLANENAQRDLAREDRDTTLAPHLKQESDGKNDFEAVSDSETLSNHKVCEALCDTFRSIPRTKNPNSQKNSALPKVWKGVTSDNHSTNTDQEKKTETPKSDTDVGKGGNSKEKKESKVPVQETDHSNHTTVFHKDEDEKNTSLLDVGSSDYTGTASNKGTDKPCSDPAEKQPATSINVKQMAKEIVKSCSDPEEKQPATSINVKQMAKEIVKPCSDPEEKQPATSINVKQMAKEIVKSCSDPEETQPATNINVKQMAKELDDNTRSLSNLNK